MVPPEKAKSNSKSALAAAAALALPGVPLQADLLFSLSHEPMLIVDADNGRIIEASPPAALLLGTPSRSIVGGTLTSAFGAASVADLHACLHALQSEETPRNCRVEIRNGGAVLLARLSLLRAATKSYFLMALGATKPAGKVFSAVFHAIENAPTGFVVTDGNLYIDYANPNFAAILGLRPPDVHGRSLLRWLNFTQTDLAALRAQLSQCEAVTRINAQLRLTRRQTRRVEVDAIAVPDEDNTCWGFSVNKVVRLN